MSVEPASVSQNDVGTLRGCLVDGDLQQRTLERRVRRRAIVLSILFQSAALVALIIIPMFGKSPQISAREYIPIPPYYHSQGDTRPDTPQRPRTEHPRCNFCAPSVIPPTVPVLPADTSTGATPNAAGIDLGPGTNGPSVPGGISLFDNRPPPPPVQPPRSQKHMIHTTSIDPAMLTYRVEPVYPTLMRQIHKDGRVELRAIIFTDGTIESLQVVSGDPGFYQSALDAVRQWRYRPTYLNGMPVEVETNITVIYKIQ